VNFREASPVMVGFFTVPTVKVWLASETRKFLTALVMRGDRVGAGGQFA
jgi:hypothetical protein